MNLEFPNSNHPQVLFLQHKCQSGLDVWLYNLSKALKDKGFAHQVLWLNHLAEPFPPLFATSVPKQNTIIHTVPALGKTLRKKCKHLVITVHLFPYDKEEYTHRNWLKKNYWDMIKRNEYAAFKEADRIISISYYTQERLKASFGINSEVIYQGVDTDLFQPKEDPISAFSKAKLKLFFTGNLNYRKGFDLLLKLAKILGKDVEIRVASGLKTAKKTKHFQKNNIVFLGRLEFNSRRLVREYQNCDIYIAASRLEGFGVGLVEAMACGRPVVALNAGPTAEIIDENEGGYVIDNLNLEEMAEKINYLRLHPELRKQMGLYNREKALTKFSLGHFAQDYINLFNSLLFK